nr:unnamed protein product [Callosobruchus chinensis]
MGKRNRSNSKSSSDSANTRRVLKELNHLKKKLKKLERRDKYNYNVHSADSNSRDDRPPSVAESSKYNAQRVGVIVPGADRTRRGTRRLLLYVPWMEPDQAPHDDCASEGVLVRDDTLITDNDEVLPENLMEVLGDDPDKESKPSYTIHQAVASRWNNFIAKGLSNDGLQKMSDTYTIPSNVNLITPKINPEVF